MAGTCCRNNHVSYPPQSNALFAALPRNSNRDTHPYQPRPSPRADLKAVNVGNPGAGRGLLSGTSSDMQRGSASRFALRSLFASCGMFRREAPDPPPGFPAFTALRSAGGEGRGCWGYVSRLLFRALREMRTTLGWAEDGAVALTSPLCCFAALPRKARYFGMDGQLGRCIVLSRAYFWGVSSP